MFCCADINRKYTGTSKTNQEFYFAYNSDTLYVSTRQDMRTGGEESEHDSKEGNDF